MEAIQSLRLQGKNAEAWAEYKRFVEQGQGQEAALAYERSILSYYVGIPKEEALLDFMRSYSKYKNIEYKNLQFYVIPFPSTITPLPVTEVPDFLPTSTSILPLSTGFLLNIRYVNYRIQSNGSYLMSENGVLSPHAHLRTRNFSMATDFTTFSSQTEMTIPVPPPHDRHIHGIEDIRLFRKGATIHWSGTTCEYSHNGLIQESQGVYDLETHTLSHITPMHSPRNAHVEKNWIPFNRAYEDDSRFIYSWYPLTIGRVTDGRFHTEREIPTPYFFQHVRGSSTLVWHNALYTMVHCVIETCPRKYYHMLVKLNDDYSIAAYTVPYYFVKNQIEYTLGIHIQDDTLICIASQNDCDPIVVRIPMKSLLWLTL